MIKIEKDTTCLLYTSILVGSSVSKITEITKDDFILLQLILAEVYVRKSNMLRYQITYSHIIHRKTAYKSVHSALRNK